MAGSQESFLKVKFVESDCELQEGQSGIVDLKSIDDENHDPAVCDNPDAVALMIDFLYLADCTPSRSLSWKHHIKTVDPSSHNVSNTGNSEARSRIVAGTVREEQQPSVLYAELYALGSKYQIPSLQKFAYERLRNTVDRWSNAEEIFDLIEFAYAATPETDTELRVVSRDIFDRHAKLLIMEKRFSDLSADIDGLAVQLYRDAFFRRQTHHPCSGCGKDLKGECSKENPCGHTYIEDRSNKFILPKVECKNVNCAVWEEQYLRELRSSEL